MEFGLYSKATLARSEMTYIKPHKAENGSAVEIMMSNKAGKEQDLMFSLWGLLLYLVELYPLVKKLHCSWDVNHS